MAKQPTEREILPVVIIGLGAEARAAADALTLADRVVYGFLSPERDAGPVKEFNDVSVLGSLLDAPYQKMLKSEKLEYVLAVPGGADRRKLREGLFGLTGRLPLTVIHPSASVSPYADVAAGVYVDAGAVVAPNARIESLVWIGPGVVVDSDASISEGASLDAGAVIGAKASIGKDVVVGTGAVVAPKAQVATGKSIAPGEIVAK